MRILHVLDHSIPAHSGYSFRTLSILREQRARGWETEHVTGDKHPGYPGPVEEVDGLRFFRTARMKGPLPRLPVVGQLATVRTLERRLRELIPELRPSVLHAHSPCLDGMAALRAGRAAGLPVVYEVRAFWEDAAVDHGTTTEGSLRYRLTRRLETGVLRAADAVTCICEGLRRDIVARGIPEEKVTVIPNAVDVAHFEFAAPADAELAARWGLGGRRVLGFLGSFYRYEGLDLLVEALPGIRERHDDVVLLLVGGGAQEGALRDRVKALGLEDVVRFTGRVPHAEIGRYYSLVDVCVYPRRSMRLTDLVTPLKPLEAMAQGRLVVASDVGGHQELIRDGETGRLFRAGDVDSLVRVTAELLDDADAPRMRDVARRFVEEERSWPVSVARYERVYGAVSGRGGPA